jgi:hypothetical protein
VAEQYVQGTVSVGTTATLVALPDKSGGIFVSNASGGSVVFFGGSSVTASGATAGPSLAAGSSLLLPTAGPAHGLYGVTASGTATVSYIFPA